MTITVYSHPDCVAHNPGAGHPENPSRLTGILAALDNASFISSLAMKQAPMGTDDQVLLAHEPALLDKVKAMSPEQGEASLDPDTHMSPDSLNAALRAVGACCQGVDDLMNGTAEQVFCATRPPGHHATINQAMGFCLFNQVAIAAIHALKHYGLERVAIVDFDVHHGNGSQDIVAGRNGLFYLSTHQSPLYPGSGHTEDNIDNNIFNVPLPGGTGHAAYLSIFSDTVLQALEDFKPQLLLVSAGFDAHQSDPLAGMALTDDTYFWLGQQLQGLANKHCAGKSLSVLEGGYNLDVLPSSVINYLAGMLES